jgi:hypothetical protein
MPTKPLAPEVLQEAVEAFRIHKTVTAAARALEIPRGTLSSRLLTAKSTGVHTNSEKLDTFPKYVKETPKYRHINQRVMHIPDLHCPFDHDELDQHSISAHDPDPNGFSPGHELTHGLKRLERYYALFKEALVCESNHGQRPFKRAYKSGLPVQYLRTYAEFMKAPQGWVWAEEFEIDGVVYTHGEAATGTNGALNLAIRMGKSQAVGHWHGNAGASYFYNGTSLLFGLYSGCLIDPKAYAFAYGKHAKTKPILGLSIIDKGIPMFCPMIVDSAGNWTGKL